MAKTEKRVASLDFLRAIAILLVLGRHMGGAPADEAPWLRRVMRLWERGGWVGVDLFFVLSGFLIAGLLFREYQRYGEIRLGRFFIRRGLKIYPAFFAYLAFAVAGRLWLGQHMDRRALLGDVVFLQNYLGSLWQHTWSLAVEEHFYLLLPLVLLLLIRRNRGQRDPLASLPAIFLVTAVALLGLRVGNALLRDHYEHRTHLFPTHLRIDSLFCGVFCAYYFHFRPDVFARWINPHRRLWAVLGVAMLLPAFILDLPTSPFIYTLGFTVFYCGSALLLASMIGEKAGDGPLVKLLAAIGVYSYSIYLWHMPVRDWGLPFIERRLSVQLPYLVGLAVYVGGSILCGIVMAKLVEYPVLRLRDRFFPSRSVAVAVDANSAGMDPAGESSTTNGAIGVGSGDALGQEGRAPPAAGNGS